MNRTAANLLSFLRRASCPSSAVRVLWLSVAILHGWLAMRRVWLDDTAGLLDFARTVLCLMAVGYASMKVWSFATILDAAPRRALAFGLLMIVLHWGVSAPQASLAAAAGTGTSHFPALVLVLPAMTITLSFSIALLNSRRLRTVREQSAYIPRLRPEAAEWPLWAEPDHYALLRRPPPFLG